MKKVKFSFVCDNNPMDMPANGNSRYCGECEKNVYDFRQFNPESFFAFQKANPNTCGFMMPWQLDEFNAYLNQINPPKENVFAKYAKIAALLGAPFVSMSALAQQQNTVAPYAMESAIGTEPDVCTEFLILDENDSVVNTLNFSIYANNELIAKVKSDVNGKLSISHLRYKRYKSISIVCDELPTAKQLVQINQTPYCIAWKINPSKITAPINEQSFDLQFVYKNKHERPFLLRDVSVELYDSTNNILETILLHTNIGGYAQLNFKNQPNVKYVLFVLHTRKGRKTAHVQLNTLRHKETNIVRINKRFKSRHVMGALSF